MEILVGTSDDFITGCLRFVAILVFVYCIYKGTREDFFINPYFLFSLTPISLLLYSEKFSPWYLVKLDDRTWVLALINMIAFLFALNHTSEKWKIRIGHWIPNNSGNVLGKLNPKRMVTHAILMSVIGIIPTILSLLGVHFPLKYIIKYTLFIGIALAFKTKKKWLIGVTLAISVLNFIEDFNKTEMLFIIMTVAACFEAYYIKTKKDRARFLLLAFLAGVLLVVIAFPLKAYTRDGGDFLTFFRNSSEISNNTFSWVDSRINFDGPYFLQMPYMYLIQGWNNLQYVVTTQPEHTYGLWAIKPLLGYFQIDSYFEDMYSLTAYSNFNTFTYITVLFKDFGFWGSTIGSLFLGFFVKKVYSGFTKDGSAFRTASYALVSMATLEMFFSNHFFGLSYPFTIVIVGAIYRRVFRLEGY